MRSATQCYATLHKHTITCVTYPHSTRITSTLYVSFFVDNRNDFVDNRNDFVDNRNDLLITYFVDMKLVLAN